jgi:ABC-2 type transport system ATP-binding protein
MDAVTVEDLEKSFGKTKALDGLELRVPESKVVALLGPNGAGKTTLIRILATLLRPDRGRAEIFGHDVTTQARQVRAAIALTGQFTAIDDLLNARENLEMVGRLVRLSHPQRRARADELLQRLDLTDAADRIAQTYSGGMRRRLDLAASLMSRPRLLFLDEPTSGIDPSGRLALWDIIGELADTGTAILLTTQQMDEADKLADNIVVIDKGKVVAEGSPSELKSKAGKARLEIVVDDRRDLTRAEEVLRAYGRGELSTDEGTGRLNLRVQDPAGVLPRVVHDLDEAGIVLADLEMHRPNLDDVFATVTGRAPNELAATDGKGGDL